MFTAVGTWNFILLENKYDYLTDVFALLNITSKYVSVLPVVIQSNINCVFRILCQFVSESDLSESWLCSVDESFSKNIKFKCITQKDKRTNCVGPAGMINICRNIFMAWCFSQILYYFTWYILMKQRERLQLRVS